MIYLPHDTGGRSLRSHPRLPYEPPPAANAPLRGYLVSEYQAHAQGSRPWLPRSRPATSLLVVVLRIERNRFEELEDLHLLAALDVLTKGLGHGRLLRSVAADPSCFLQQAIIDRDNRDHPLILPNQVER